MYKTLLEVGPLKDAEMLDIREHNGRYYFSVSGGDCGFHDAIEAIKEAFVFGKERRYHPEKKEWSVPATRECEARLCNIFSNAENAFKAFHSQMKMF